MVLGCDSSLEWPVLLCLFCLLVLVNRTLFLKVYLNTELSRTVQAYSGHVLIW